jgi:transposase
MKNYEKSVFKHLTETLAANEKLKVENKSLRSEVTEVKSENRRLRSKIEEMEQTLEARINNTIKSAIEKATQPLLEIIDNQGKEISRLKSQINKDSSNSSKPPSSDGLKKVSNNREPSNKKRGGQYGHKGSRLIVPKDLDELVKSGKAEHEIVDRTNGSEEYISQWEINIKTKVLYTEYRCSTTEKPFVYYGNSVKSYSSILLNEGFMPLEKVSDFLCEITDGQISPSLATLEKFNMEIADKIETDSLKNDLLNGEVIHVDETPMNSTERLIDEVYETSVKTTFDVTIRTHSNATTTLYTVNPRKDDEGVERDGIIPLFQGIFSHDHDKKYYKYGKLHATCGAHLSRELKGLHELYRIEWADKFSKFYVGMNDYKNQTDSCKPEKLQEFERTYDELLKEGDSILDRMRASKEKTKSLGYDELRPILKRLLKYKDAYLLFIRNYVAPFTNNQAERDLRYCKTKQKISGCFRSWEGLLCFAKIRSFLSTALKRNLNLFHALKSLFPVHVAVPC